MTMVLGVKGKDGIYLSSDRQATFGGDVKSEVQKIFRLGRSGLVGVAGSSWICGEMIDLLRQNFSKEFNDGLDYNARNKIVNRIASTVNSNKRRITMLNTDDSEEYLTSFGMLIGFLNKERGGKRRADMIYSASNGISMRVEGQDIMFNGSLTEVAIGFANEILRGKRLSKMESGEIKFVMYKIIRDIEEVSTSVGYGVDILSLSNDGRVEKYSKSDLKMFEDMYKRLKSDEAKIYRRLYSMLRREEMERVEENNRRRSEAKR